MSKWYEDPGIKAGPVGFEPTIFGSLHFMGVGARCPILVVLAGMYCGRPRSRLRSRLALCWAGMIKLVMGDPKTRPPSKERTLQIRRPENALIRCLGRTMR